MVGLHADGPPPGVESSAVPTRIVSGGQDGADRGALVAARELGIPAGGWCPLGGWAEDLPEPPGVLAEFPELRESTSGEPEQRTRANVRDSDATLVMAPAGSLAASAGTLLAHRCAQQLGRPVRVVDPFEPGGAEEVNGWLDSLGEPVTLNVAGPRESEAPGLRRAVHHCLLEAFGRPPGSGRPVGLSD